MIEGITSAIVQASEAAKPVDLLTGVTTQQTPVSFQRRYLMKNGEFRTWGGLNDPNVHRAAGPIDPEIGMLLVRDVAGKRPAAVLSSFALHLDTVGGTLWSADYPFFIDRTLRSALGADCVSVFANGCCGNINHVHPIETRRNSAEFIGTSLGNTIAAAIPQLAEVESPRLQVRREVVKLPLQNSTPEELKRSKERLRAVQSGKTIDFYEHVDAYKRVMLEQLRNGNLDDESMSLVSWGLCHSKAGSGDALPVDVQVITLGRDVAIVALPGEIFVEYGLQIKSASPFKTTLVVELCNNSETVYIPTRNAYLPTSKSFTAGGYEVVNSTTMPGSGDMLVDAALRLLIDCARHANP